MDKKMIKKEAYLKNRTNMVKIISNLISNQKVRARKM
jgi:hypothetical protein